LQDLGINSPEPHCERVLNGIEKIYSSAMRIAAPAFIQDPLTLDVILNAPALTHQGIALARDRLRHLSRKRRHSTSARAP
jgi:proline dehydrogenase